MKAEAVFKGNRELKGCQPLISRLSFKNIELVNKTTAVEGRK